MTRKFALAACAATLMYSGAALADHLNIDAENAMMDGNTLTFPAVKIDKDGFVVIHAVRDGEVVLPGSVGHTMVKAGDSSDVVVEIDDSPADSYIAMLHYDTDGDGKYSFGEGMTDVDGPALNAEEKPYVKPVKAGM